MYTKVSLRAPHAILFRAIARRIFHLVVDASCSAISLLGVFRSSISETGIPVLTKGLNPEIAILGRIARFIRAGSGYWIARSRFWLEIKMLPSGDAPKRAEFRGSRSSLSIHFSTSGTSRHRVDEEERKERGDPPTALMY
jgi:hypothetical protein